MNVTKTAIRALSIIKAEPQIAGDDLGRHMWPGRSGQATALLGFGYLGKLIKAGWVIEGSNPRHTTANGLTISGRHHLERHVVNTKHRNIRA